jgi:hypothetical protein
MMEGSGSVSFVWKRKASWFWRRSWMGRWVRVGTVDISSGCRPAIAIVELLLCVTNSIER